MGTYRLKAAVLFLALTVIFGSAYVRAQDEKTDSQAQEARDILLKPSDIKWMDAPPALPKGAKIAILEGDPKTPGPLTMRLKFPANYRIPPHTHIGLEHVTVLSGVFHVGKGDKFDPKNGAVLNPGSFFVMVPGTNHFAWTTKREAVIQIHSTAPWDIKYVDPADDPRNK